MYKIIQVDRSQNTQRLVNQQILAQFFCESKNVQHQLKRDHYILLTRGESKS